MAELHISQKEISRLTFRDKRIGWRRFGLAIDAPTSFFEPLNENPYIQVFLKNLDLRPSCYACPSKSGKSHSDITLADFWKLRKFHNEFFDEKGVSLVMINSRAGSALVEQSGLELILSSYENGLCGNPAIEQSATLPAGREEFIKHFQKKKISVKLSELV